MNLDTKALVGFIAEIEASRARQKAETEFQRDVFKRARAKHFDNKAIRIVLQRRAMGDVKRDEQDYTVHAYELALGAKKDAVEAMEQGASAREAAEKFGLPRAAVTALKAGTENGNFEPEIEEVASIGADAGRPSEPSPPAEQSVSPVSPPERVSLASKGGEEEQSGIIIESCGGDGSDLGFSATVSSGTAPKSEREPGPQDPDDLAIPSFLRREQVRA